MVPTPGSAWVDLERPLVFRLHKPLSDGAVPRRGGGGRSRPPGVGAGAARVCAVGAVRRASLAARRADGACACRRGSAAGALPFTFPLGRMFEKCTAIAAHSFACKSLPLGGSCIVLPPDATLHLEVFPQAEWRSYLHYRRCAALHFGEGFAAGRRGPGWSVTLHWHSALLFGILLIGGLSQAQSLLRPLEHLAVAALCG